MVDVFISYARAERPRAEVIKVKLDALGIRTFFDLSEIDGGDEFPDVIDQAVRSAKVVLACWSPLAFTRPWVMRECRHGQKRGILVPIALEAFNELDVPIYFTDTHYFDLTNFTGTEPHEGWSSLLQALSKRLSQQLGSELKEEQLAQFEDRLPHIRDAVSTYVEARREMYAAICESPLTLDAFRVWDEEWRGGKILLRDIMTVEAFLGDFARSIPVQDDYVIPMIELEAWLRPRALTLVERAMAALSRCAGRGAETRSASPSAIGAAVSCLEEMKLRRTRLESLTEQLAYIDRMLDQHAAKIAQLGAEHGLSQAEVQSELRLLEVRTADESSTALLAQRWIETAGAKSPAWSSLLAREAENVRILIDNYCAGLFEVGMSRTDLRGIVCAIRAADSKSRAPLAALADHVLLEAGLY